MKKIIVPVDGSRGAGEAVRFAAKLAKDSGAELTLLHVYDAPMASQFGLAGLTDEDFERAMKEVAKQSFEAADAVLGPDASSADHQVAMGHPAEEICGKAQTLNADLVVMGTRGRSELESILLGSVSERVLRHAPCPVTVVR